MKSCFHIQFLTVSGILFPIAFSGNNVNVFFNGFFILYGLDVIGSSNRIEAFQITIHILHEWWQQLSLVVELSVDPISINVCKANFSAHKPFKINDFPFGE